MRAACGRILGPVRRGWGWTFALPALLAGAVAIGLIVLLVPARPPEATEPPVSALGVTVPNTPPDLTGADVTDRTLDVGGVARTWRAFVPTTATPGARLPLVVVLAGRGEGSWTAVRTTGFLPQARLGHAVLVYPDGIGRSWNAGKGCCGPAAKQHVDDVAFVAAVVSRAVAELPVDPDQVFLVGYSNGGKLAYAVACDDPTRYAGVATYGAVPLTPCPTAQPVPVLLAAGVQDAVLPFTGARTAHPPTMAVRTAAAGFAARDRCPGPTTTTRTAAATISTWTGCAKGVQLVVYPFAGHGWPPTLAGLMWGFLTGPATRSPVGPPTGHA
jgi:polyhydroxybutyrate depolymerase